MTFKEKVEQAKRIALDRFHNDYADGDLAIGELVTAIVEAHEEDVERVIGEDDTHSHLTRNYCDGCWERDMTNQVKAEQRARLKPKEKSVLVKPHKVEINKAEVDTVSDDDDSEVW